MKSKFFLLPFFLLNLLAVTSQTSEQVIVRLNFKLLDWNKIDDNSITSLKIGELLNEEGKRELSAIQNNDINLESIVVSKMFPNLHTKDSISIGRQGQIISIPPFWATFKTSYVVNDENKNFISKLKKLYPIVIYAHPNYKMEIHDVPNDPLFDNFQSSLYDFGGYPNGHINVDSAWTEESGKWYIKVGVFDTGVDSTHEDLDLLTGWGYYDMGGNSVFGQGWHGTNVAGIIGAKRNNNIGIAGIAGGNGQDSTGVSLLDFKYNDNGNVEDVDAFSAGIIDASRSVGSYYFNWTPGLMNEGVSPYWDQTPGYGIHIGNHSYAMSKSTDPKEGDVTAPSGETGDVTPGGEFVSCDLCREAFLFSLQNGVINIVSRGNVLFSDFSNDPNGVYFDPPKIPAAYDDSWVINVGASGTDGNRLISGINTGVQSEGWFSPQGRNIDIIAPGTKALVTTTLTNDTTDAVLGHYTKFNGTSASAPHVSGVAALLLSKYNKNCYSQQNLDPADVEYIIQKSATDKDSVGYDINTGWGLLHAHKALKMIDFPRLQIVHPKDSIISSYLISQDTIAFFHNTSLWNLGPGPLSLGYPIQMNADYKAVKSKYRITYDFSDYILPTTELLDIWVKHSTTNTLGNIIDTFYVWEQTGSPGNPDSNFVMHKDEFRNEPMAKIINSTNTTVTLEGYVYHFIGLYDEVGGIESNITTSMSYWYPFDPSLENPKMSYSIYIKDSTLTARYDFPCDSLNELYDTITPYLNLKEKSFDNLTLYPNPTSKTLNVNLTNDLSGYIRILDPTGRIIKEEEVKPGRVNYTFNVDQLSTGVYYLRWSNSNGVNISKKWIKL